MTIRRLFPLLPVTAAEVGRVAVADVRPVPVVGAG